ncbi:diacylglycerol kinase family protein [Mycoplasma enhydrae]|uniref:diacylglycerol/lipid kinase family protein n=1 Tax=Mycoplasma enhydrae TaxID=2499220 RepID=UPI0021E7D46F|nr:diacylglycerol kinase family protein [Mycoplasma enhydrae]MCV3733606.1 diacylglycerol kinase family protein [Mycoplasma enhydrae]
MLYVLYNLLSKSGKNQAKMFSIVSSAIKTFKRNSLKVIDITKIVDYQKEMSYLTKDDIIVIIGGDGTLTYVLNELRKAKNLPDVYAYKAGTGNDFIRNIKASKKYEVINRNFYKLNSFIKCLPTIKSSNLERSFLNGVGLGVDVEISKAMNTKKALHANASFFRVSLECIKNFQTKNNIKMTVDDKEYNLNDVSLIAIMNGPYFGGGMKIAPKANLASDKLSIIVISGLKPKRIIGLFGLVYLGLHIKVKYVKQLFGKYVKIENVPDNLVQVDGETFEVDKVVEIQK